MIQANETDGFAYHDMTVIDNRDGVSFVSAHYCRNFGEAILLARLTWKNKTHWTLIPKRIRK
jgi:hypothetical protein